MTVPRRISGENSSRSGLMRGLFLFGFLLLFPLSLPAQNPPYDVEIRIPEASTLQLFDPQGRLQKSFSNGTVRQRLIINQIQLLASCGSDSRHRFVALLTPSEQTGRPVGFRLANHHIVVSPGAIFTLQLLPDGSSAQASSGAGKIWINGILLARGQSQKISLFAAAPGDGTHPDQPRPSINDFQPIAKPSL